MRRWATKALEHTAGWLLVLAEKIAPTAEVKLAAPQESLFDDGLRAVNGSPGAPYDFDPDPDYDQRRPRPTDG